MVVQFRDGDTRLALLVEDKIDAEFQPDQPERYLERAERLRETGAEVLTLLVAPATYIAKAGAEIFDRRLAYERIVEILSEAPDPRLQLLARCLQDGFEAYRRGYVMVPQEAATAVWAAIYSLCSARFPKLRMEQPSLKPGSSH